MSQQNKKGKVVIAGAGPGDPDLITIKAARYLQAADVILTDRLVSPYILQKFAAPTAIIVYVGKQAGSITSTPQATINELLVLYAKEHRLIVRLKGGDVSIFSNILDELETLVQHNIAYEIVPGITAAMGAAAYAGIPLTARRHAGAVRFLSTCSGEDLNERYWQDLAQTEDSLVFYMSTKNLEATVNKLLAFNINSEKLIAVIENATTPQQKIFTASLQDYSATLSYKKFASPTLIIIGKVVALHQQFAWFNTENSSADYFNNEYATGILANPGFALTA